jgi:hypothetical protein
MASLAQASAIACAESFLVDGGITAAQVPAE